MAGLVEHGLIVASHVADWPVVVPKRPQPQIRQEVASVGRRELAALLRPCHIVTMAEGQREVGAGYDVVAARGTIFAGVEGRSSVVSEAR